MGSASSLWKIETHSPAAGMHQELPAGAQRERLVLELVHPGKSLELVWMCIPAQGVLECRDTHPGGMERAWYRDTCTGKRSLVQGYTYGGMERVLVLGYILRDALGSLPAPCLHLCTDAWAFPWKITCLQSCWEEVALFFHLLLPGKQQVGLSEM